MKVSFDELKNELERVLLSLSFSPRKAELCASVFASNSRDGVYSHGLTRFPVFVGLIKDGLIDVSAEPACIEKFGMLERWTGNGGLGIYNATLCTQRAIELAKTNGIGCVAIQNTNHWLRGGTYGWQAADAGCICINFTNAIAGMPPWGGSKAALGNNPVVIAIPREDGNIVLDMAISQYSYGKMQEYQLKNEQLPYAGGYDIQGNLSTDPNAIMQSRRTLPIGLWKGSGLALMIDILVTSLSGGRSTKKITADVREVGVSQLFICIHPNDTHASLIEEILEYTKSFGAPLPGQQIRYPGENTLRTRKQNERDGIPVNKEIWESILTM